MFKHFHKRHVYQLALSAIQFVPVFVASYYAAFLLRFAGELDPHAKHVFLSTLLWLVAVKGAAFAWFRLHQVWTRFVGFDDLLTLAKAVTCGAVGLTIVDAMWLTDVTIPRSVIVIDWGTTLLAVAAVRAIPRLIRNEGRHFFTRTGITKCFIVGADYPGETLLRNIRDNPSLTYRVLGFIDDRAEMKGRRIGGVPVLGTCQKLPQLAEQHEIEEVLIMSGGLSGKKVRQLVESAPEHEFRVKVLPSFQQLLEERVAMHPRAVAIEDLLSRESVDLDLNGIREWITGRVVMITGSAGSIGSEICRQLLKLSPARLVLVDRAETGQFHLERELRRLADDCETRSPKSVHTQIDVCLADLTDRARLETLFAEAQPEIIFHAAAYKHVPLMEAHCGEAIKNIVLATRHLVDLADKYDTGALVMISTDKAVNPTSVMGSCKRLAEQYVQAFAASSKCRFVTVRFGNVLDSSGSVVPIFREQIALGGPITITHPDITRYFMLIPEAAQLVLQAGAMGRGGEIFVLDMGEPVRIVDLANDMIRLSGLRVGEDIEIQIVGLRPGEKLYEELYDASENHQRTTHPKIMVAASARRKLLEVIHDIGRLEMLVDEPNDVLKEALQEIIFAPQAVEVARRRAA
jgi:FlaA1/EpsC-like NDP-sugar epimerase